MTSTNNETRPTESLYDQIKAEGKDPWSNALEIPREHFPEHLRDLRDTVVASEFSALDTEVETAEQARLHEHQKNHEQFLLDREAVREAAKQEAAKLAVHSAIAADMSKSLDDAKARQSSSVGTYSYGYLPQPEVDDLLDARKNGTPL